MPNAQDVQVYQVGVVQREAVQLTAENQQSVVAWLAANGVTNVRAVEGLIGWDNPNPPAAWLKGCIARVGDYISFVAPGWFMNWTAESFALSHTLIGAEPHA